MNRLFRYCLPVVSLALFGAAPAGAVLPSTPAPSALTAPRAPHLAQASRPETVLFFETESMAVRIFRRGESLFMNLYNKATNTVEVNATPAELVPSSRDQTVYTNTLGEAERFARINVLNETELEIRGADGSLVLQEAGFHTVVGVPAGETTFAGHNFAPGTGAVVLSAQAARLRAQPRLGSEIIGTANRREIVEVIDRVGNPEDGFIWYQVTYQGQRGWVRGDLLQPV